MPIKYADVKIREARSRIAALDRELADLRRLHPPTVPADLPEDLTETAAPPDPPDLPENDPNDLPDAPKNRGSNVES